METFIGTWVLETNENLDEFLTYYGYSWVKRKAALASNIDLTIDQIQTNNAIKRTIDSTFMKNSEIYNFNSEESENEENLIKSHLFHHDTNSIISNVKSSDSHPLNINWVETAQINGNKLIIKRSWLENGIQKYCTQNFVRKLN